MISWSISPGRNKGSLQGGKDKKMKKRLFRLLAAAVFLSVLFSSALCEDGFVHISDAAGLFRMSEDPSGSYILDNDIDLSDVEWTPIRFSGTLDGNGHSILHLSVHAFDPETGRTVDGNGYKYKTNLMGFFSIAENAVVRNLSFPGAIVSGTSGDHAFAAVVAAVSTHSVFENLSVSGSVCLFCGGKMGGVAGLVGFGTGSISDSTADLTLIYADTDKKKKCEQFLGGAVADGFMDVTGVTVRINGYASVYGYAHCGGLIGMHRQHEKRTRANAITHVSGNTVTGEITFFEKNRDRRAYCKGIMGERLNKYVKMENNDDSGFTRNEIRKYDEILLPEGWESAQWQVN